MRGNRGVGRWEEEVGLGRAILAPGQVSYVPYVPVTMLTEACYLLEGVTLSDLERTEQLLQKYSDANVGLVDASAVAIAERLGFRVVVTTDRRHFGLFRPKHCRAFELLP